MIPGQFKYLTLNIILLILSWVTFANNPITLEEIYLKRKFQPKLLNAFVTLKDGKNYCELENDYTISKFDLKTGTKISELLNMHEIEDYKNLIIDDYSLTDDETKILLTTETEYIYRHSFRASYLVYDVDSKKITPVSYGAKQQLAEFSPDGTKVAFVRDNNLFYKDLKLNIEKQITLDGEFNYIINGCPDWVYEEEFGISKGFEWSSDSKKIAFYRFDESIVKLYKLTYYQGLYPEWYEYKYPMAGEDISVVTIHIYDFSKEMDILMDIGSETNQYIPRIKWSNDNNLLCIARLNRPQNNLDILLADAGSGISRIIYTEKSKYYISRLTDDYISFVGNGKEFVVMSEKDGYRHFYLYSIEGKLINQITKGLYDVLKYDAFNEKTGTLYYESNEGSAVERHVFSISKNGTNKKRISNLSGTNNAFFDKNMHFYILIYSNGITPYIVTLYNLDGTQIRVIEDNQNLKELIKDYGFAAKEFITIPTDNNIQLNGYMIKPPDFNPDKKYPVFMYVYGGPEIQVALNGWDSYLPWFELLAQHGYIVACIDNRGTEGRGEEFRKCTYKQLGKFELIDQINAAKYFGSLPYVDDERIGIFGWSYGGYLSLLCLLKGNETFKSAIAVAPVTDWRFYDAIYTERYLGMPNENSGGYDEYAPINLVDSLQGNLLLVHGEVDDNVHVQNTMEFIKSLVKAGKQFEMQIYPNKNHFINGGKTSYHVFTRMTNFLYENL